MNARVLPRIGQTALALLGVVIPLSAAQAEHCGCSYEEPPPLEGRMTGGGSIFTNGERITHGFQLRCDATAPQNLQMNWKGHRFHLTSVQSVSCTDDPDIDPGKPDADFDTITVVGTGRCNNIDGATIIVGLQDAGEPGVLDYGEARIWGCPGGDFVMYGLLDHGNHQAHME